MDKTKDATANKATKLRSDLKAGEKELVVEQQPERKGGGNLASPMCSLVSIS